MNLAINMTASVRCMLLCSAPLLAGLQSRYQIHRSEVSAVDCASDGSTVVSGSSDGRIVLWSHVTGFKLAVFTVHKAAIRSLSFNSGERATAGLNILKTFVPHMLSCFVYMPDKRWALVCIMYSRFCHGSAWHWTVAPAASIFQPDCLAWH